jgi:lipoate-protein ligase A
MIRQSVLTRSLLPASNEVPQPVVVHGRHGYHADRRPPFSEEPSRMHGEYKMPGGKLIVADLELHDDRLAQVRISGDFFLEPDAALPAIDRALEGLAAATGAQALAEAVRDALPPGAVLYGISPEAVAEAVRRALPAQAA